MSRSIPTEIWQNFVALLAEAVSRTSEEHPTVRVWKDTELIGLINEIAKANHDTLRTTFPPGKVVLDQLERMGWLRRLPLTKSATRRTLFLMEQEATKDVAVDSLEVLQAVLPSGLISYFGAISFHELTSQMPAFFHVGRLANGHPPESAAPVEAGDRNPLGTYLFEYDGVRCYETKRYRGLTPGVQRRVIGPRTSYRITTMEQTLLDAILQPVRCGGEAVVFEAWGHASKLADFDRMTEHLQAISRDSLVRRVGAMLEMMGAEVKSGSVLAKLLVAVKSRLSSADEMIPLLPGLSYPKADHSWRVSIP